MNGRRLSGEHLTWSLLVPGYFLLGYYGIPLLHGDDSGVSLGFQWELQIPYIAVMSVPYVLCYGIILLPPLFFSDINFFRRGAIALLFTMTVSFLFFIFFPVRFVPPPPQGPLDRFLLSIHWFDDNGYNAFPSLHVGIATVSSLSLLKVNRLVSYSAILLWAAIFLSTLLLKRHYLVDSIAGIALGVFAHFRIIEPEFQKRGVTWRW